MNERLKIIREHFNKSQQQFAKSLGLGQSTLAMMEVGKREILDRHIKTICSVYGIDEKWFTSGEGQMIKQPSKEDEIVNSFATDLIKKDEISLLKLFFASIGNLSDKDKIDLCRIGTNILENMGYIKK